MQLWTTVRPGDIARQETESSYLAASQAGLELTSLLRQFLEWCMLPAAAGPLSSYLRGKA